MMRITVTDDTGVSQTYWRVPEVAWLIELSALVVLAGAGTLSLLL
jgi:hypothetical protein